MKYAHLIGQMTLEEKAGLMSGGDFWHTKPVPRLGIPAMLLADGPHGLRKQKGRADRPGLRPSFPATCFPTAAGLANSWNPELMESVGRLLGEEAAAQQVSVLLGPGCNIKRNPLCGRNFEYFSEDPFLSGKLASALIRGIQANGVAACAKHFAANSQELWRMANDSVLDERTLREIYLPAFEMAVKEGGVRCLMSSYNLVNGSYANENTHLLADILRGEWGYGGVVVSDWGGNNDRVAALRAGSTLEMPSSHGETDRQIVQAVKEGRLDEAVLDRQVNTLLELLFETQSAAQGAGFSEDAHHSRAAEAAAQAAVLLKNDGLLPLEKGLSVALVGDFAARPRYQGAGSSKVQPTRLESLHGALLNEGVELAGFEPGFLRSGKPSARLLERAVRLAKSAGAVVLCLGLAEGDEAEGADREHMRLPQNQLELLAAVHAANPRVAVVLSCGCAVEMGWDSQAAAVIHGYLGGQAGALAMAGLLSGRLCPCGKLAESIPLKLEDVPSAPYYPGREATSEYREGIYVGYRYYLSANMPVKYPFGHGLSYTTFEYSGLAVEQGIASFFVENTGGRAGAEVAELYIAAKTGGIFRPLRELKGFCRVELEPGQKKRVEIRLDERSFAVWSVAEGGWVVEPGEYEVQVGASAEDVRLKASVYKGGPAVANPYAAAVFEPYRTAGISAVPDAAFAALLGRPIPPALWDRGAPLGFCDVLFRGAEKHKGLGRTLAKSLLLAHGALCRLGKKGAANGVVMVLNLPFRALGRMSGLLSDAQVLALLGVVNREKGGWRAFFGALFAGKSGNRCI